MALNVNIIGRDSEGNLRALKVNSEGNLEISGFSEWGELLQDISDKLDILVSGTAMRLFGATIEERPSADSVEVGTTFTLTNAELDTWISNGTDWVELPPQLKVIRGIDDLIVEEGADLNG